MHTGLSTDRCILRQSSFGKPVDNGSNFLIALQSREAALRTTVCGDYVALSLNRTWCDATSYPMRLVLLISLSTKTASIPGQRQDAIEWVSSRTQTKDQHILSRFETRDFSKDVGLGLVGIEH